MMRNVYIIAADATKFGKYIDLDHRELAKMTVDAALEDANIDKDCIQSIHFANCLWGFYNGQHGIRGHIAMRHCGFDGIPVTNVEAACTSGTLALHSAWKDILTGLYDCTMAVGVEKLNMENKEKQFKAFNSFVDVVRMDEMADIRAAKLEKLMEKINIPQAEGERSRFMDSYAFYALSHMVKYDTDPMAFAVIAAKNHHNGSLNPKAQYQFDQTPEEAINDRMVSYPLTRSMCSPIGDGAACAILCSEDFLRTLPQEQQNRAVKILASEYCSGRKLNDNDEGSGRILAQRAYKKAGKTPEDVDVAELHDASAPGEMLIYEDMGFCPVGKGGEYALSGATQIGGKLPVNTSGGLIARGHPLGATGLAQIYELMLQLRGEAGVRQVKGARVALAENHGGSILDEASSFAVTILERV